MRWRPGGVSSDIEDRRGQGFGGGTGIRIGLGGAAVLLVLSLVTGQNFFAILEQTGGSVDVGGGQDGGQYQSTPEENEQVQFVSFVLDDVQGTWQKLLPASGRDYRKAKLVLFTDATQSACGVGQSAMGPFYCPLDEKVYIDLGFYRELKRRFGAPGDFAQAYVIAHEMGHHVQNVLGISEKVRKHPAAAAEPGERDLRAPRAPGRLPGRRLGRLDREARHPGGRRHRRGPERRRRDRRRPDPGPRARTPRRSRTGPRVSAWPGSGGASSRVGSTTATRSGRRSRKTAERCSRPSGCLKQARMPEFRYQEMFPHGADTTPYRRLDGAWVGEDTFRGQRVLTVDAAALTRLAFEAIRDISHLFRPGHLAQLRKILDDPEASTNDRFVALNMLRNACVSAGMVLPSCQDTGTAIVIGKKGQHVWTSGDDETALARGVFDVYQQTNLRYSQMAPLSTFEEQNTGTNLPAQLELYATGGDEYRFLFVTKGGGSANKAFLFQETPRSSSASACSRSWSRRSRRSARRLARPTTSRSSSAARRPSSR
jgi:hypothetical protein